MFRIVCIILFFVIFGFHNSSACNGYELILNEVNNCDPANVIKLENFELALDKDCNVIPKGCIHITKTFTSAKLHYVVAKSSFAPLQGDIDLCEALIKNTEPTVLKVLQSMDLQTRCPIRAAKICENNKKLSIDKYRHLLPMITGNIVIKANVVHDTGKTCMEIKLTLQRTKRG